MPLNGFINAVGRASTQVESNPIAFTSSDTAPVITVMPACPDKGDGEVWIDWNAFLDCDLQPGQTFSYTNVPAEAQADCEFYGGTFLRDAHICYGVDF